MWTILSFTGEFRGHTLEKLPAALPPEPRSEQDKQRISEATEARGQLRVAEKIAKIRLSNEEARAAGETYTPLTLMQDGFLTFYDDGSLRARANRLTLLAGNGRMHYADGTWEDIGGTTGGCRRPVLDDSLTHVLDEYVAQDLLDLHTTNACLRHQ